MSDELYYLNEMEVKAVDYFRKSMISDLTEISYHDMMISPMDRLKGMRAKHVLDRVSDDESCSIKHKSFFEELKEYGYLDSNEIPHYIIDDDALGYVVEEFHADDI